MAINLLPWRERRYKKNQKIWLIQILIGIGFTLSACIIWQLYLNSQLVAQQKITAYWQQIISALTNESGSLSLLQQQTNLAQEQLKQMEQIQNKQRHLLLFLQQLPQILPAEIYLTKLTIENNRVVVTGNTLSNAAVNQLLKNFARFGKPILIEINNNNEAADEAFFEIEMEINE